MSRSSITAPSVAQQFLAETAVGALSRVVHHHETFRVWDGSCFRDATPGEMRQCVARFVRREYGTDACDPRFIGDVVQSLQDFTLLPGSITPPVFIDHDAVGPDRRFITVENGLLDLDALFGGVASVDECLLDNSPAWFSTNAMAYLFDPDADCPNWLDTLMTVLEGDRERIRVVQEWFGYCLVPGNEFRKFLMLTGDTGTGKSTILNVLVALLGATNVASVPMEALGKRFQMAALLGKLCNVVFEIGTIDKVAEGWLKTLTGNDAACHFERKGKDPFAAPNTCKLAFATNNLPRYHDRTDAVVERHLLIPCRRRLTKKRENWVEQAVMPEMAGVFNWSLVGRYRLLRQRGFSASHVGREAIDDLRESCNPHRQFIELHLTEEPGASIEAEDLFAQYRGWMGRNGFSALGSDNFGRILRSVFPLVIRRKRGGRKHRFYVYEGIHLGQGADLPAASGDWRPEVEPPSGLLAELWARFTPRAPLCLPGPVAAAPAAQAPSDEPNTAPVAPVKPPKKVITKEERELNRLNNAAMRASSTARSDGWPKRTEAEQREMAELLTNLGD
jgi:P4 family phage/plasmid primase-like protien